MKIIAKTNSGYLIEATETEVENIIRSTSGVTPKDIQMGTKIPGIDYASTITKIQSLKDNYEFKQLVRSVNSFNREFDSLVEGVKKTEGIESDS